MYIRVFHTFFSILSDCAFQYVNNLGVLCEIVGFVIILCAIRMVKSYNGGSFTCKWDKVGNVMVHFIQDGIMLILSWLYRLNISTTKFIIK